MNQIALDYWKTLGQMNKNDLDENDQHTKQINTFIDCIRNRTITHQVNDEFISDVEINLDIVEAAILRSKNNKSPGIDMITNEILKNGGKCLNRSILALFNRIIPLEKTPKRME